MKKQILFLGLLVLSGCIKEPTEPVYEPEPNIGCLLSPNYKRQEVRVGKSWGINEEDPEMWVSGAEVKISCASDTVTFYELPDTPGVYVSESLLVESGNTYFLEVNYPDDSKVTGKTTVPQRPRIITPADRDTVSPDDELQWESEGASGFRLHFYFRHLYDPEDDGFWSVEGSGDLGVINSITFDSVFVRYADYATITGGEELTIRIWAVDTNYYDYYRIKKYDEPMEPNMHLDGGLGVFGSFVVSNSISVVMKP